MDGWSRVLVTGTPREWTAWYVHVWYDGVYCDAWHCGTGIRGARVMLCVGKQAHRLAHGYAMGRVGAVQARMHPVRHEHALLTVGLSVCNVAFDRV